MLRPKRKCLSLLWKSSERRSWRPQEEGSVNNSNRKSPAQQTSAPIEPWQTWGHTVRYLAIRVVVLLATVIVAWLAYRLLG